MNSFSPMQNVGIFTFAVLLPFIVVALVPLVLVGLVVTPRRTLRWLMADVAERSDNRGTAA